MIGRTYLLTSRCDPRDLLGITGQPGGWRRIPLDEPRRVVVLARAGGWKRGGPARNVLVEDLATGERIVRPFRGLRVIR